MSNYATRVVDESTDPVTALTVQEIVSAASTGGVAFTSTEKDKLAAIEDNATADQTGAEIVAAIDSQLGQTDWKTQLTTEQLQDAVAAMLQGGSHTNLIVTYDDGAGTLSLSATGGGGLDQEQAEDIVGALVAVTGGGINVAYDDGAGTLTFSLTGESYTTAEQSKLAAIEAGATADQTSAEIAAAYANEVAQVSGGEITAGTETALRTYSPADIAAFVAANEDVAAFADAFTVTSDTVILDRGLQLPYYDHTVAAGEENAPPPNTIFISTAAPGLTFHRLSDGTTRQMDNNSEAASASGSSSDNCCVPIPTMVDFAFEHAPNATPWPDSLQAGDVVILYRIANGAMTTPADWTRIKYDTQGTITMEVAAITATGSETGEMPDDNELNRWVFVIRGTAIDKIYTASTAFNTTSPTGIPFPSLTETSLNVALVMGFSVSGGTATFLTTYDPTTYIHGTYTGNHIVFNRCAFLGAVKPAAFISPTDGVTNEGHIYTIGFTA